jgi:GT2 family glycosyltransferase
VGLADLPAGVAEVELTAPEPELRLLGERSTTSKIMTLVRLHTYPMGVVVLDGRLGPSLRTHAATIWARIGESINRHLANDGIRQVSHPGELTALPPPEQPPCHRVRRRALARRPLVTVIIATRERPDSLHDCLYSVLGVDYPRVEVIVVDNDPVTTATQDLVARCFGRRVRYLREMRRGLGAAHNRGVVEAMGEIVAFVDDDVVVDGQWLAALVEGFTITANVGCVTGLILPAQLETPAQVLLERHGGFDKGFEQMIFDRDGNRPNDPLYPFRAGRFGSGANMAFDAQVLRRLRGFDPATGTGTFARGGDDLTAFFRVVVSGNRLVYQPGALVWHRHHRDLASLGNQAYGYGVGLGAYLVSAVTHEPAMLPALLRRVPRGLHHALRRSDPSNGDRYRDWPAEFAGLERRGMLVGPFAYLVSRWRARGAVRPSVTQR